MREDRNKLLSWAFRRAAMSALLLLFVMSTVFWVVRLAPGNPLDQIVGEGLRAADRNLVRHQLGLDDPMGVQYLHWLASALRGDWGNSISQQRPVQAVLAEAIPATLLLTVSAYVLNLILAILGAMTMAVYRGRAVAQWVNIGGLVLYSLPSFWFGLMLLLLFSVRLGWFPLGGLHSPDAVFMGPLRSALDVLHHLILPVCVLGFGSFMGTARFLRETLEDAMAQDYILTARARGLTERVVLWRHVLRNAMLPLITQLGLQLPFLLGGAVVVEVVFGWPGMGRVTIEAIWSRDYPLIMATTFWASLLVVVGSQLADLGYHLLDPRIRLSAGQEGP